MAKTKKEGKKTIETSRAARQFLKERNLTGVFTRFKNIRGIKKIRFSTEQDNISQRLIAHKRGNKIIVRDAFSLRVLAQTKRFNLKTIRSAFRSRNVDISLRGSKGLKKKNILQLKELTRIPLTNVIQIDRQFPLRKKVGKLFMNITFRAANNDRMTVEGGSRSLRLLNVPSQRKIAFNEAFQGALSQIFFSYETFTINWVHFSYFLKKKSPQPVFHEKEIIRAV